MHLSKKIEEWSQERIRRKIKTSHMSQNRSTFCHMSQKFDNSSSEWLTQSTDPLFCNDIIRIYNYVILGFVVANSAILAAYDYKDR